MFPLGSVLFPHMPVLLRVFEDRYLVMLSTILQDEPSEFGIALIERGQEVGGGEQRFGTATVARITQLDATEGFVVLVAEGGRRVAVEEWLEEDPYPRARVRELPELEWNDELQSLRDDAEADVRRILALSSEFTETIWPSDIALAEDPVAAAWQLAAIAPLGSLDQLALLGSESCEQLLTRLIELVGEAEETLRAPWADGDLDLDDIDRDD